MSEVASIGGYVKQYQIRLDPNKLLAYRLPCTYDGRPYERFVITPSVMPQGTYQRILRERKHSRHRWENEIAEVKINDLDAQEIRRTIQTGIAGGRLATDTSANDLTDVLDRVGLLYPGEVRRTLRTAGSRSTRRPSAMLI